MPVCDQIKNLKHYLKSAKSKTIAVVFVDHNIVDHNINVIDEMKSELLEMEK